MAGNGPGRVTEPKEPCGGVTVIYNYKQIEGVVSSIIFTISPIYIKKVLFTPKILKNVVKASHAPVTRWPRSRQ